MVKTSAAMGHTIAKTSAGPKKWLPNFFHAGFPKTATTWFHRCLREHPDVYVPPQDALHFLTCNHHQGLEWYQQFYNGWTDQAVIADTTPSYAAFDWSRKRLAELNPDAKILITLRNPIDRAFSHYWHYKEKREPKQSFEAALQKYPDLYSSWIGFGFYHHHISDLLQYFPRQQIHFGFYEDINRDPLTFCASVFEFLSITPDFVPSCLGTRINTQQTRRQPGITGRLQNLSRRIWPKDSGYKKGMSAQTREQLQGIYRPEIEKLSVLLDRDLTSWLDIS